DLPFCSGSGSLAEHSRTDGRGLVKQRWSILPTGSRSTPCKPTLYGEQRRQVRGDPMIPSDQQRYRFINSGCFGGSVGGLRRFLATVLADSSYWRSDVDLLASKSQAQSWAESDAVAAQTYYMRHPELVAVDFGASLSLSLRGLNPRHFVS
ncbi:unnamed protein product, partial [Polarella glacialis]